MIGPRPWAYACAYVDPIFTIKHKHNKNELVRLSSCLYLCPRSVHLLTHVLVLCLCLCASKNQALVGQHCTTRVIRVKIAAQNFDLRTGNSVLVNRVKMTEK